MGYRLIAVIFALVFVVSCSAFDKEGPAIEGFGEADVSGNPVVAKDMGKFNGYYSGAMTLESNTCQSISDEVGVESALAFEVLQEDKATLVNLIFDEKTTASGELSKENKGTFMVDTMGVKHVYMITFNDKGADGSCEVVEADEAGQYGDPCAKYAIAVTKGEKPAAPAEEEKKEGEEAAK